jgi:four helix bundle protein
LVFRFWFLVLPGMIETRKSRSYKDLEVWQLSLKFVKDIYQVTGKFPSSERFGLTQQIRRAAVSIPSNIAEGQFTNSSKEFNQFLFVALGSAAELETQLIIAGEIDYLSNEENTVLLTTLERIIKMLKKLSLSLKADSCNTKNEKPKTKNGVTVC